MAERLSYKPIPFIGPPSQRGTGSGSGTADGRYVNVRFEIVRNEALKEQSIYCVKRPGISSFSIPPGGTSTGRGIYAWGATQSTYSVFHNVLYAGATSTLMNTSTGRVWFVETPVDTGAQILIVSDGRDNYNVTSSNVVTQINQVNASNYPVSNLGPILFMDGYAFQGLSTGRIRNTNLNSNSSWATGAFITADTHGGAMEAIYMQKDQIVGLTKNRIEFFYNNGNPTGSPLLRIDQNTIYVGIASKESLAWSNERGIFVGENASGGGGRAVYQIASQKMSDISTPVINRFLDAEGPSISSCTAWMAPVAGEVVYCLNVQAANRSFIYGTESGMWSEWTAASGARFNCVSATHLNGVTYLQDASSGQIYSTSTNIYQDKGVNFTVTLQTNKTSFGTPNRKKEPELSIIGDITVGTLGVSLSDDDFASFDTERNIDMSLQRKRVTRLGSFYERAHRFTYAGASSLRVQAYVPMIVSGSH